MTPILLLTLSSAWAGSLSGTDTPKKLDQAYESKRIGVLIGVDDYSDPELDNLAFAGKDAHDLARTLRNNGNFDQLVVLNGLEHTTRAGILTALDEATADLQRDDTFLLYLSGHGTLTIDPRDGTKLWFLPSDSSLESAPQSGIDIAWLRLDSI